MSWACVPTPWGEFYAGTDGASIIALRFPGPRPGELGPPTPLHDRLAAELGEYLAGRRREFGVPFLARGTPFQQAVWKELVNIPYGTTITYRELASRLARPRAARAVGQALAANPLPILIPCHRVLPAGGGVGGFGPGPDWKRRLLALEGARR
ncbi:methylated-DNA--[protein]-cysteine S-methyltransferase [Candidatus Bipolaricaulota bacterium]|nr:methylated-DNA--[protein]-cysteine S-methyltransferase [Candidatus Bipolaricaulota bacterium]